MVCISLCLFLCMCVVCEFVSVVCVLVCLCEFMCGCGVSECLSAYVSECVWCLYLLCVCGLCVCVSVCVSVCDFLFVSVRDVCVFGVYLCGVCLSLCFFVYGMSVCVVFV